MRLAGERLGFLMAGSVCILTEGSMGAMKTLSRCAFFMSKRFLPYGTGEHWSNFPVKPEAMAERVADESGRDYNETLGRIRVIDEEEIEAWKAGSRERGPWTYFAETDLEGAHIALDEFHFLCSRSHRAIYRRKWVEWVSQIRKRGATIEFITQDVANMAEEVYRLCTVKIMLTNWADRRDPFARIKFGDWCELIAAFTGTMPEITAVDEMMKRGRRWQSNHKELVKASPALFALYDSYNKPDDGSGHGSAGPHHVYLRLGRWGTVRWFFNVNGFYLLRPLAFLAVFMWVCFGGGLSMAFDQIPKLVKVGMALTNSVHPPVTRPGAPLSAPVAVKPVRGILPAVIDEGNKPTSDTRRREIAVPRASQQGPEPQILVVEGESDRIKPLVRPDRLTFVMPDRVGLEAGGVTELGRKVALGPMAGSKVSSISVRERTAAFESAGDVTTLTVRRAGRGETSYDR